MMYEGITHFDKIRFNKICNPMNTCIIFNEETLIILQQKFFFFHKTTTYLIQNLKRLAFST